MGRLKLGVGVSRPEAPGLGGIPTCQVIGQSMTRTTVGNIGTVLWSARAVTHLPPANADGVRTEFDRRGQVHGCSTAMRAGPTTLTECVPWLVSSLRSCCQ